MVAWQRVLLGTSREFAETAPCVSGVFPRSKYAATVCASTTSRRDTCRTAGLRANSGRRAAARPSLRPGGRCGLRENHRARNQWRRWLGATQIGQRGSKCVPRNDSWCRCGSTARRDATRCLGAASMWRQANAWVTSGRCPGSSEVLLPALNEASESCSRVGQAPMPTPHFVAPSTAPIASISSGGVSGAERRCRFFSWPRAPP